MKVTIRKKPIKNGKTSLYLDIYHLGKRRYEFLNLYLSKNSEQNKETKILAEKIRSKREVELQNELHDFIPDYKRRTSFIQYFESAIKEKHKWSNYYSTIKALKKYVKGDLSFYQINDDWLEKFKFYLLSNYTQNTASTYFQVLKRILKQARKDKIVSKDLGENTRQIPLRDSKRGYLTKEEIQKLAISNCQNMAVKKAFLFSCFSGIRFSDLKSLKWQNIVNNQIQIIQQKTKEYIYIPLSKTAENILSLNTNESNLPEDLVFNIPNRWFTNELIKRWFKVAEINKHAHFHLARHTFATLNITEGSDLYTVSKLLGHKHLKTTEIYAKLIDQKKNEAISKLPIIEIKL